MSILLPSPIKNYIYQSFISNSFSFLFKNYLTKIKYGYLEIDINDTNHPEFQKHILKYGNDQHEIKTKLKITNLYRFFIKVLFSGDIGFSESFILGDFTTRNLKNLIYIFIINRNELDNLSTKFSFLMDGVNRFVHYLHRNTIEGAKENIKAHYDLSNDMFLMFLDPTMSYSCAYFDNKEQDLETAQFNKIRKLIDSANLSKDDHLLEIGCGWGALAIEAVKRTGCRVTGISLSQEQLKLARERVKKEGLEDRIQLLYIDYRNVIGQYDRIISCEMLEAVGYEHYSSYFESLERLLKPNGLVVLQFISFRDQDFNGLKKRCDFIQKYIFPGSLIPSVTSLLNAATNNSQLVLQNSISFGTHYSITLDTWRKNFISKKDEILKLNGFNQQFINMFDYYFCYCSAAFETRTLNVFQITLSRPCNIENLNDF